MPELAEVDYYRCRWNPGINRRVLAVSLHPETRVFRGLQSDSVQAALTGALLKHSAAHGKQMLFRFTGGAWLGLHLGMTGRLHVAASPFPGGKHDHLILHQVRHALVFSDPRQFGRIRLHLGRQPPSWWSDLPAPLTSAEFSHTYMVWFLNRHAKLPLKTSLLLQDGFPGIGNWMADEILWRCRLHPKRPAGQLNEPASLALWQTVRWVCRRAMQTIAVDFSDPPKGWLFHQRWHRNGRCPRDKQVLRRESIGGRTTAWCPRCQSL